MSRSDRIYRTIEVAMWDDPAFRALSAPEPNAQTLWIYLLTGRRTMPIPGVIVAREAVLADDLRWFPERFGEPFAELCRQGLVNHDWEVGLVWLPRALRHSDGTLRRSTKPPNPNVIRGWGKSWERVPECQLKLAIYNEIQTVAERLGEPFAEGFREGFGEPCRQGSPKQDSGLRTQDSGLRRQEAGGGIGGNHTEPSALVSLSDSDQPGLPGVPAPRPKSKPAPPRLHGQLVSDVEGITAEFIGAYNAGFKRNLGERGLGPYLDIVAKAMKAGFTSKQMRAALWWCIEEWADDPEWRKRIEPNTVLKLHPGPKGARTLSKYLDNAEELWRETHSVEPPWPPYKRRVGKGAA